MHAVGTTTQARQAIKYQNDAATGLIQLSLNYSMNFRRGPDKFDKKQITVFRVPFDRDKRRIGRFTPGVHDTQD